MGFCNKLIFAMLIVVLALLAEEYFIQRKPTFIKRCGAIVVSPYVGLIVTSIAWLLKSEIEKMDMERLNVLKDPVQELLTEEVPKVKETGKKDPNDLESTVAQMQGNLKVDDFNRTSNADLETIQHKPELLEEFEPDINYVPNELQEIDPNLEDTTRPHLFRERRREFGKEELPEPIEAGKKYLEAPKPWQYLQKSVRERYYLENADNQGNGRPSTLPITAPPVFKSQKKPILLGLRQLVQNEWTWSDPNFPVNLVKQSDIGLVLNSKKSYFTYAPQSMNETCPVKSAADTPMASLEKVMYNSESEESKQQIMNSKQREEIRVAFPSPLATCFEDFPGQHEGTSSRNVNVYNEATCSPGTQGMSWQPRDSVNDMNGQDMDSNSFRKCYRYLSQEDCNYTFVSDPSYQTLGYLPSHEEENYREYDVEHGPTNEDICALVNLTTYAEKPSSHHNPFEMSPYEEYQYGASSIEHYPSVSYQTDGHMINTSTPAVDAPYEDCHYLRENHDAPSYEEDYRCGGWTPTAEYYAVEQEPSIPYDYVSQNTSPAPKPCYFH